MSIEYEKCERIVKVPMRSLDSLITGTELKISHIDVIKINDEGAKVQILKGAINTIVRSKPYIIVDLCNEFKPLNCDEKANIRESIGLRNDEVVLGTYVGVFGEEFSHMKGAHYLLKI